MAHHLQELYQHTFAKYKKYNARFKKNLQTGLYYEYSEKKQRLILQRIEKLRQRLASLKLQLKLAIASGALILALNTSAQAQQLGPFVENAAANPLKPPITLGDWKSPALIDIDGDGDLDLFIGFYSGDIKYYENTGTTTNPKYIERTGTENPLYEINVGNNAAPFFLDFDGDGDYDIAIGNRLAYGSNDVLYYQNDDEQDGIIGNNPSFTLISGTSSPINGVKGDYRDVHPTFVDFDNNGDYDAFIGFNYGPPNYNTMNFFVGNGSTFTSATLPVGLESFGSFGSYYTQQRIAPTFSDIDSDGNLDLVTGSSDGTLRFFKNITVDPNNLEFEEQFSTENPFDGINIGYNSAPIFADLDGDGDPELIIGTGGGNKPLAYYKKNNDGIFIEQKGLNNPFGGVNLGYDTSPVAVDIDQDGDIDLIIGEKYGTSLHLYINDGEGNFTEMVGADNPFENILPLSVNRHAPDFIDVDNDGDFDLFVGVESTAYGPTQASVLFFRNDGNNNFISETSPITVTQYYTQYAPALGDFDGDGDYDVVLGTNNPGYSEGNFIYLENDGTTLIDKTTVSDFNGLKLLTGVSNYAKPVLVDLDHDGDLDVVSGVHNSTISGELILFTQNNGVLTKATGSEDPFAGLDVGFDSDPAFFDKDNDGDLDIIVGTSEGTHVYFENQNEPPKVVTALSAPINFTENSTAIILDANFTISDDDNDDIISAEIAITGNFVAGQDVLSFAAQPNITGTYSASTGILKLTGYAPLAEYEAALKSVTYRNTSDNPSIAQRTVTLTATDFDATNPTDPTSVLINVTAVNDAPVLVNSTSPNSVYREGEPDVVINDGITVSDVDNTTLASATISIGTGFSSTEDVLQFTDQNGITGSYDNTTGILTLSGTATLVQYEAALRSVTYLNTSNDPSAANRIIHFVVNDGTDNSNTVTRTVEIIPNAAPVVTTSSNANSIFNEGGPEVIIDAGIMLTDSDNTSLAGATVSIGSGFISTEDVLQFTDQNGLTGSYDTSTGILTLSGTATLADYEASLQSVTYFNTSSSPDPTDRIINFVVNDGVEDSNTASRTVEVVPNSLPVITTSADVINYTENDLPVLIAPEITVADNDNSDLVSGTVTISSGFVSSEDQLELTDQSTVSGIFDNQTGILELSGTATLAEYEAALRSITYLNLSEDPDAGARTITFTVNDGLGDSNPASKTIEVTPVNDQPIITSENAGTTIAFDNPAEPIIIDDLISITDPDDTELTGAQITIGGFASRDILAFAAQNGIIGDFDGQTGILELSGIASIADYTSALRSITFETTGTGQRQIEFTVNDGEASSIPYSRTISITLNQSPIVNTTPLTTQVGGIVTIDLCDIISDPDNTFAELTITVINILSGATTTIDTDNCTLTIDYEGTGFKDQDEITLQACDPSGACTQNIINIQVEESDLPVKVYNAVSPNGDNLNDFWEIDHLTTPNKIELFNRWGDLVKTLNDYSGQTPNDYLNDLPAGTYFYKIKSPKGTLNGYLLIKK